MIHFLKFLNNTHTIDEIMNIKEIDFSNEKRCNITITNFHDDLIYLLFRGKDDEVLLKLNSNQSKVVRKRLNKNEDERYKNNDTYQEFLKTLKKIKEINKKLRMLHEKKIKIILFNQNIEQKAKIEEEMLKTKEEKEQIQTTFCTWLDFLLEDNIKYRDGFKILR